MNNWQRIFLEGHNLKTDYLSFNDRDAHVIKCRIMYILIFYSHTKFIMYILIFYSHTKFFSAEIKTVVCDKNVKVKAILSRIKETPDLESIILVEEPSEEMKELAQKHNINLTSFAELEVRSHLCSSKRHPILAIGNSLFTIKKKQFICVSLIYCSIIQFNFFSTNKSNF